MLHKQFSATIDLILVLLVYKVVLALNNGTDCGAALDMVQFNVTKVMEPYQNSRCGKDCYQVQYTGIDTKALTMTDRSVSTRTGKELQISDEYVDMSSSSIYLIVNEIKPNNLYDFEFTFHDNNTCEYNITVQYPSQDSCGTAQIVLLNVTQVLYENEICYEVDYQNFGSGSFSVIDIKCISTETEEKLVISRNLSEITHNAFYLTIKDMKPNKTYDFVFTLQNLTTACEAPHIVQLNVSKVMEAFQNSHCSKNCYQVKYTKTGNGTITMIARRCVSTRTGKNLNISKEEYVDISSSSIYLPIIDDMEPNNLYDFVFTFNESGCIYDVSVQYFSQDYCGTSHMVLLNNVTQVLYKNEHCYKVDYQNYGNESFSVIDTKCISTETGEELSISRFLSEITHNAFYLTIKDMKPNKVYDFVFKLQNHKSKTGCTYNTTFQYHYQEKAPIIYAIIGLLACIVFFAGVIIFNIETLSECMVNIVEGLRNRLYMVESEINMTEINVAQPKIVAKEEVNLLYEKLEEKNADLYEFPSRNIEIKVKIGEGEFGKVYYAKAHRLFGYQGYSIVAVKQLKSKNFETSYIQIETTAERIERLSAKPKDQKMWDYEIQTSNDNQSISMADLKILKISEEVVEYNKDANTPLLQDVSIRPPPALDHIELQNFALQIASGMEHLERIGVTHRYVNCFRTLKVMGVGAQPYENMLCHHVLLFLKSGQRLGRPEICSDDLYDLMLNCWKEHPDDRPDFSELVQLLRVKKMPVYVEFNKIKPDYNFPKAFAEE
ncbi:unnamed protein product [Phaedon cochleariae]|uniref:Protein kinase domain-containing protein n=1 Tax=Phaedon cochleariae TaxID=80249 RepID=A0A9N9X2Y9_PHACE|nr:unnamed protein product [Phaedon cochleariae]